MNGTANLGSHTVGLSGNVISIPSGAGNWISLDADASTVQVQYLVQPGGGGIEVWDGEQLLTTLFTDGETAAGHYDARVSPGPHHFEVRTISADARLPSWLTMTAMFSSFSL